MLDRILLVEDNKTLSKLIAVKIRNELDVEVDIAYTRSEAELFTKKYSYTLSILDLNLPDAPEGEIVDAILSKKIPAIVLTGRIDKAFRAEMLKKDIIDYVYKGSVEDINFVIETIRRLLKNRRHKVMVVDDSLMFRNQMKKMLEALFFDVYALAHGEEALSVLNDHPDIKMVITDYNMPVMDGLELTREIRKKFDKSRLTVFILSSNEDAEVSARFLKQGANDFIQKPFSKEEFACRVNNAIEALENVDTITHFAHRDFLTGLYNRRHLYDRMAPYFAEAIDTEPFVTAMIGIDAYRSIVERYGKAAGEEAIILLSEILRSSTGYRDIVARLEGEDFCLVLKGASRAKAQTIFEHIQATVARARLNVEKESDTGISVSIGAAAECEESFEATLDEADAKLHQARTAGGNRIVM